MFSDVLKTELEKEIVGQRAAIASVVRSATRVISGLTPRERSWSASMFMGPSGTGKTQLVRTLATVLHGENRGLHVADCTHFVHGDPWASFVTQLAPMFSQLRTDDGGWILEAPPASVLLIEYLERGRKEIGKAFTAALDTGRLPLPGGRLGSLRNCMVFITTSLCAREILEESPRIGFHGAAGPGTAEDNDRLSRACRIEAETQFGDDLIGRLDGVVVFHRLHDEHVAAILDRRFDRMSRWIRTQGFDCELMPAARAFLLERGRGDVKLGARELVNAHRRHVEFPLADLLISRRIPVGGRVSIDHLPGSEHLHFTVTRGTRATDAPAGSPAQEVPIAWEATVTAP